MTQTNILQRQLTSEAIGGYQQARSHRIYYENRAKRYPKSQELQKKVVGSRARERRLETAAREAYANQKYIETYGREQATQQIQHLGPVATPFQRVSQFGRRLWSPFAYVKHQAMPYDFPNLQGSEAIRAAEDENARTQRYNQSVTARRTAGVMAAATAASVLQTMGSRRSSPGAEAAGAGLQTGIILGGITAQVHPILGLLVGAGSGLWTFVKTLKEANLELSISNQLKKVENLQYREGLDASKIYSEKIVATGDLVRLEEDKLFKKTERLGRRVQHDTFMRSRELGEDFGTVGLDFTNLRPATAKAAAQRLTAHDEALFEYAEKSLSYMIRGVDQEFLEVNRDTLKTLEQKVGRRGGEAGYLAATGDIQGIRALEAARSARRFTTLSREDQIRVQGYMADLARFGETDVAKTRETALQAVIGEKEKEKVSLKEKIDFEFGTQDLVAYERSIVQTYENQLAYIKQLEKSGASLDQIADERDILDALEEQRVKARQTAAEMQALEKSMSLMKGEASEAQKAITSMISPWKDFINISKLLEIAAERLKFSTELANTSFNLFSEGVRGRAARFTPSGTTDPEFQLQLQNWSNLTVRQRENVLANPRFSNFQNSQLVQGLQMMVGFRDAAIEATRMALDETESGEARADIITRELLPYLDRFSGQPVIVELAQKLQDILSLEGEAFNEALRDLNLYEAIGRIETSFVNGAVEFSRQFEEQNRRLDEVFQEAHRRDKELLDTEIRNKTALAQLDTQIAGFRETGLPAARRTVVSTLEPQLQYLLGTSQNVTARRMQNYLGQFDDPNAPTPFLRARRGFLGRLQTAREAVEADPTIQNRQILSDLQQEYLHLQQAIDTMANSGLAFAEQLARSNLVLEQFSDHQRGLDNFFKQLFGQGVSGRMEVTRDVMRGERIAQGIMEGNMGLNTLQDPRNFQALESYLQLLGPEARMQFEQRRNELLQQDPFYQGIREREREIFNVQAREFTPQDTLESVRAEEEKALQEERQRQEQFQQLQADMTALMQNPIGDLLAVALTNISNPDNPFNQNTALFASAIQASIDPMAMAARDLNNAANILSEASLSVNGSITLNGTVDASIDEQMETAISGIVSREVENAFKRRDIGGGVRTDHVM